MQKVEKKCVMHVSPSKLQLILCSETDLTANLFATLQTNTLFDEFLVESLNNNEVGFEINLEHLSRSLKSSTGAGDVVMKLTKKNGAPYLSFAIALSLNNQMTIIQDIPIVMLTALQLSSYVEPSLPEPQVYIILPSLKKLRQIVDRMRNVDSRLSVFANMAGSLLLKVESESATIATFFKNLQHPSIQGRSPPREDPEISCELRVDIKKFYKFLYAHMMDPKNVICCMVEGRALILHVVTDELFLTYYISAITA